VSSCHRDRPQNHATIPKLRLISGDVLRSHFMIAMDTKNRGLEGIESCLQLFVPVVPIVVGAYISKDHDNIGAGQFHSLTEPSHFELRPVDVAGIVDHVASPAFLF